MARFQCARTIFRLGRPGWRSSASLLALLLLFRQGPLFAQTSLTGSSIILKSLPTGATMSSPGYVGTYLTIPSGGSTINFTVNASEGPTGTGTAPHMNLVIADSSFGINVASTSATNYTTPSVTLPAGTYFVRAERDYANSNASTFSLTLNNLTVNTVSGAAATFSNSSNDTNAFASADTYIANFRQGPATVHLSGLPPGTPVSVNLKRIDFNFGNAIPGTANTFSNTVNNYLGSNGTPQQVKYQQTLNQDFNSLTPENAGKWASNEATQNVATMAGVDTYLNYAQAHNMTARAHNLIWGSQQPTWVSNLITASDTANLSTAITNRINYYVGGTAHRSLKYGEIDVYNESYHTGESMSATKPNYWSLYGASGIANIYNQVAAAVTASGATTKTFVNEYNVLQNSGNNFATYYLNHINEIRDADGNVGGIGVQYYPSATAGTGAAGNQHSPARIISTLQNLSVEGLPISLNEFGVSGTAPTVTTPNPSTMAASAQIMADTMRLMFGTSQATGFYMWGFHSENGGGLFAPAAAMYAVDTSNWNTWTITDAGKAYEDLLGVKEWDGVIGDGWTTQLDGKPIVDGNGNTVGNNPAAPMVDANGNITFTGYYGDYQLTIGGKTYPLDLQKGVTNYAIAVPEPAAVLLAACGLATFVLIVPGRKLRHRCGPGFRLRRRAGQLVLPSVTLVFALAFAPADASAQDFTINKVVGTLNQPTFVTFAPGDDNDLYIAELVSAVNATNSNLGRIIRYNRATQTKTTVVDLTGLTTKNDGGVVGIAFHPDFQTNGLFYVDYNAADSSVSTGYSSYIQEYHINANGTATLTPRGTILSYPTLDGSKNYHTVDWIGFDPTATGPARNYLYVTTGDGGPNITDTSGGKPIYATSAVLAPLPQGDPNYYDDRNTPYPINPRNIYGKILRLDINPAAADAYPTDPNKNFAIPPTNPFAAGPIGPGNPLPEVMAGGFKNPFRGSFDSQTGDMYLGDVGNVGQEEIDFIKAGTLGNQTLARNFGWPVKEGLLDPPASVAVGSSVDFSNPDATVPMIDPIKTYPHSVEKTIIGGLVYHGPIASLNGQYIYGDYSTDDIYTSNFDRNTLPSAFNGANLTNNTLVRSQWESLIVNGDPAHKDLEFPVDFAEDSKGNLYVVVFGNSPTDSLNAGSVRGALGLGIGEIYELLPLLGDVNRDGHVDAADISALMTALTDLKGYEGSLTDAQFAEVADLGKDGTVTNADLQGLIVYLANGGGASLTAVPEPSSLALAALAALLVLLLRKSDGIDDTVG
jgi:GH35 family endo-1,4-beta-xylanase